MSSVDVKLVLLGNKNVGKTAIFNRYVYDEFGKTSMTIGAYFGMKQLKVGDRLVQLAIWDTAGEEKFDSLTNFYCRNALAAVIVYDMTIADTFTNLQRWVDKISTEADPACSIIIVGNKLDVVEVNPSLRRVDIGEAKRYANSIGASVIEASAKSGENINDAFQSVVNSVFAKASSGNGDNAGRGGSSGGGTGGSSSRGTANLRAPQNERPKSSGCC